MATVNSDVCRILAEFYIREKQDGDLGEFFKMNDVGLPLAYMVAAKLAEPTEKGAEFITQTWEMFAEGLGISGVENMEFRTYTEILQYLEAKSDQ